VPAGGLAVLCVAQFVVVLDVTIVAIALPAISRDLGFQPARLSWVITAYTVVLAGLLILGGRTADLLGAARMFRVGLVAFSVASLACALAWSPAALICARVAQGVGAALLSPAALAALDQLIERPGARRRALGWWTAAAAGGGASGWVLGGVITEFAGWRWIFAVNAPIGLGAALISLRVLSPINRPRSSGREGRHLDLMGALSVTAGVGLGALGLSMIAGDVGHWTGWLVVALASAALTFFIWHEARIPGPLVPGSLIARPGVVGGNLTAAALTASTTPAMLATILYVQDTLRLSPARGSLLFPSFSLAVIGGALLGPFALSRIGVRATLLGGFGAVVVAIALLFTLPAQGLPILTLVMSFAMMGSGLGAASVASTTAGTAEVPNVEQGVAAGLLNSTAQLGTALGLAVTSPLVASAAAMTGYRRGFAAAAIIGLAGAISSFTVRRRRTAAIGTESSTVTHSRTEGAVTNSRTEGAVTNSRTEGADGKPSESVAGCSPSQRPRAGC
jgi:MFS family permease